ncbi:hypothetical protein LPJ60_003706 [Coemansia sp. RSA 2675]|uniref:Uncharacterized protein n=1 Tax=Coemansia linderi TaxID=2663919 RepID=A0ACC1KN86_9FUNG|nr:hypothetical protein LPJ60_003706 [Coemansia sp. RSA 2675]KAJ2792428.1 hypothetical protein GGI18_000412 [Coemansia linderi]
MKFVHTVLALAAGLSVAIASGESPSVRRLFRRNTTPSDVNGFKGAILLKNGQQTSCEVALMRNTYGFVAASCLDYLDKDAKSVNQSTIYEVAISGGNQVSYGTAMVSKVTPNPRYDPKTFANNLAVVEFTGNGGRYEFVNYIASWRPDWSSMYYVRRSMVSTMWNMPVVAPYTESSEDLAGCARANRLFLQNQKDMMCNKMSTPSPLNSTCSVPYGSVYGVNGVNIAIAALYSHSAIYGDNVCGGNVYNYYTVMENYVHWAMSVLKTRVPVYHSRVAEYTENMNPEYTMTIPGQPSDIDGVKVVGGDIYRIKTDEVPKAEPEAKEEEKEKRGGLSIPAIVAIVLGALLVLGLALYLYRKKQQGKLGELSRVRKWWMFGGMGIRNSQGPPAYPTHY